MRYLDGSLVGDLNDNFSAQVTGNKAFYVTSSVDEENTNYDLIPTIINQLPILTVSIVSGSQPKIKPLAVADTADLDYLYVHDDGTVKVRIGTSFMFYVDAKQPQTYNVNNGKPQIIEPTSGLTYVWTKDGNVVGSGQSLSLTNVGILSAGTYVCEISNDVGPIFSEFIVLEVLNLETDPNFYVNRVLNGYAVDGVDSWESVNDAFTTRQYTKDSDILLSKPNRIDLTGYNTNMFYPKPQLVNPGRIKNFDLAVGVVDSGSYFTRTKYTYEKLDGVTIAQAYQDIDLSDIIPIIKGGIYGVNGIKGIFGCYIGNGISNYIPTERNILPEERVKEENYDMGKPRVSIENFKKAGSPLPIQEQVYVLVQEMNNETVLKTYRLSDQWTKKIDQYRNYGSYLSSVPTSNAANAILYAADDLFSENKTRYNYGQYVSFESVDLDRLNKQTTKLRVSLIFQTNDDRIFDTFKEYTEGSDEVFELLSWQLPYYNDSFLLIGNEPLWQKTVQYRTRYNVPTNDVFFEPIINPSLRYPNKSIKQTIPSANPPCGLITGINLVLVPDYARLDINVNRGELTSGLFVRDNINNITVTNPFSVVNDISVDALPGNINNNVRN